MSSFLYTLGRFAYRRKGLIVGLWIAILVLVGASALSFGKGFEDKFTIPGTEAQTALDSLAVTLPQMAQSSAQLVFVAPDGDSVQESAIKAATEDSIAELEKLDQVDTVGDPFGDTVKGLISDDKQALILSVQLNVPRGEVTTATTDDISRIANELQAQFPGSTASAGGDAYSINGVQLSITEVLGLVVALVVLALTFGSMLAAGVPLVTAILGVIVTTALIVFATVFSTVSSTTPLLSLMLGLAVGIDYALFILSRHRNQLRDGVDPEESAGIAVATAGSAVVFAGLTVIIALVGLFVANIPFLTVMGIAAAVGVAIAVIIALTLLPAIMGMFGDRLRPKVKTRKSQSAGSEPQSRRRQGNADGAAHDYHPIARRWVRFATKVPALTIVVIVVGLGLLAIPAQSLRLALPTNGESAAGTPARVTYDLVTEHFGPGQNAPLLVTASIIESTDPLGLVTDLSDTLAKVDGVSYVALATPNANADTAIIQLVPTTSGSDAATSDLVQRLRAMAPQISETLGVDIQVTGVTALQIDVSNRLGDALLPFGIFVAGLSLILLAIVFRSIWVPLKATVGYLLSVLAAFGVTSLVFEHGWFASLLNIEATGPLISFMPIILMGVLFGLAMDYEVFLVSRMREDFVHSGDAKRSVESGFVDSARVVTAAAVIMFAVFAAFVPEGEGAIKAIALGLAVGVFVDAFIVRMTLVPAVLMLLGKHAWWLPKWLDRIMPSVDIEGAGVTHMRALADWPGDESVIAVEDLSKRGSRGSIVDGFSLRVGPGELVLLTGARGSGKSAISLMLSGRMAMDAGRAKVLDLVLPEQSSSVRRSTMYIACRSSQDAAADIARVPAKKPRLLFIDDIDTLREPEARSSLAQLFARIDSGELALSVVMTSEHPELANDIFGSSHIRVVDCTPPEAASADHVQLHAERI